MQTLPFSSHPRGLHIEALTEGYGFAFNFENPSGVKLLQPAAFSLLKGGADGPANDERDARTLALLHKNPQQSANESRITVWLHVINGCNFACHYCYIPHLNKFVDRETIEKHSYHPSTIDPLLSNLLGYCEAERLSELHINFAGGEPTLNLPLVEAFCKSASAIKSSTKITFGMISNGSFDTKDLVPLIQRYGINLSLSVDGYEDSHDRIRFELRGRQKVGSWKLLTHNVRDLVKNGIFPYFLYTITQSNYRQISEFATYIHGLGLGFRLSLVRAKLPVSAEIQSAIADELLRLYEKFGEMLDADLPIQRYACFAEWNLYRKKRVPCSSCRQYFAIDTAGNVASCQMRMDRTYGNAVSEQFSQIAGRIRSDPANSTLSKPEDRKGLCVKCQFFHVCASGCPQHNEQVFGEMDHPSSWCHVYGTVLPQYVRAVARQLQRMVVNHKTG